MKNSIKLLIVVIWFTMATESYGQIFGVKAGLNLSNMLLEDDEDKYSDDFKFNPGFHIGPTAEFLIAEMISFETALLVSTKGYKSSDELTIMGEDLEIEENLKLFYLDIPLTAKLSLEVEGAKVYGVFGPYLGMGFSGNSKSKLTAMGETESFDEDVEWGSDEEDDHFRRLDYGLTVGAGVEVNAIQIGLTYGLGLANISSYTGDGSKINNRVLGISIGYRLVGK
jgi:hypothetical protein